MADKFVHEKTVKVNTRLHHSELVSGMRGQFSCDPIAAVYYTRRERKKPFRIGIGFKEHYVGKETDSVSWLDSIFKGTD